MLTCLLHILVQWEHLEKSKDSLETARPRLQPWSLLHPLGLSLTAAEVSASLACWQCCSALLAVLSAEGHAQLVMYEGVVAPGATFSK